MEGRRGKEGEDGGGNKEEMLERTKWRRRGWKKREKERGKRGG